MMLLWLLFIVCPFLVTAVRYETRHGIPASEMQSQLTNHTQRGFRIEWLNSYSKGSDVRYAAIWSQVNSTIARIVHFGQPLSEYKNVYQDYVSRGHKLLVVSAFTKDNTDFYSTIWEPNASTGNGTWVGRNAMTEAKWQELFKQHQTEGYRVKGVTVYGKGVAKYAAFWVKNEPKVGWVARTDMSSDQFRTRLAEYDGHGLGPQLVVGYNLDGRNVRFAAIWEKPSMGSNEKYFCKYGMTSDAYQQELRTQNTQGYILRCISGYPENNEYRYVAVWMKLQNGTSDSIPELSSDSF